MESGIHYELRLYIFGTSGKSESAIRSLERICQHQLKDSCTLEIIDLSENPETAVSDQILATPTLIRRKPTPECRIIGDLSKTADVLSALKIDDDK